MLIRPIDFSENQSLTVVLFSSLGKRIQQIAWRLRIEKDNTLFTGTEHLSNGSFIKGDNRWSFIFGNKFSDIISGFGSNWFIERSYNFNGSLLLVSQIGSIVESFIMTNLLL